MLARSIEPRSRRPLSRVLWTAGLDEESGRRASGVTSPDLGRLSSRRCGAMGTSTWTGVPATYMMPPSTTPASATSAAPATTTTTTNSTPPASGPEMRSRTANATRTVTTRGKAGSTTTTGAPNGHQHPSHAAAATAAPLSARKSQALDLSTVERRGQPTTARESPKRMRPYGLQEAPTFRPTPDEFKDPVEYIQRIAPEGRKYGMLKIIPPDSWKPGFCIDTEVSSSVPPPPPPAPSRPPSRHALRPSPSLVALDPEGCVRLVELAGIGDPFHVEPIVCRLGLRARALTDRLRQSVSTFERGGRSSIRSTEVCSPPPHGIPSCHAPMPRRAIASLT